MEILTDAMMEFLRNSAFIIPIALLIAIIALFLHLIIRIQFKRMIHRISKNQSRQERRLQKTRLEFLTVLISNAIYLIAVISILFLIPGFRTFSVSLLAGAGIIAIIIGVAAQKTIANIVAGVSIVIYTPFRIGDRIKIDEMFGDVEDITLRHTVIRTWDNRRIFIPNTIIAEKEIINFSIKDEKILWTIDMGISYDSDIDKAKQIMLDNACSHPEIIYPEIVDEDGNVERKEPAVKVTACKDSSVNLKLYFWVEKHGKAFSVSFDLIESIKKEFDVQGIEIPFPHRTIVFKKDLDEKMTKSQT